MTGLVVSVLFYLIAQFSMVFLSLFRDVYQFFEENIFRQLSTSFLIRKNSIWFKVSHFD